MRTWVPISLGGTLGALARYGLTEAVPVQSYWATMVINGTGCFLMGALLAWVTCRTGLDWLKPALGTGFLGGYTTFSTFSVDTVVLVSHGHFAVAGVYLLGTVLVALIGVWLGSRLAQWWLRPVS